MVAVGVNSICIRYDFNGFPRVSHDSVAANIATSTHAGCVDLSYTGVCSNSGRYALLMGTRFCAVMLFRPHSYCFVWVTWGCYIGRLKLMLAQPIPAY